MACLEEGFGILEGRWNYLPDANRSHLVFALVVSHNLSSILQSFSQTPLSNPSKPPAAVCSAARMKAFKARFPRAFELGRPLPSSGPFAIASDGWEGGCPILLAEGLSPDEAHLREETWGTAMQVGKAWEMQMMHDSARYCLAPSMPTIIRDIKIFQCFLSMFSLLVTISIGGRAPILRVRGGHQTLPGGGGGFRKQQVLGIACRHRHRPPRLRQGRRR